MTVAQHMKKIRKKNGLSQKEVAGLIGVSPGAVCRWEKGDREIFDWVIKAYSAAFHVPETYFLEEEEETRNEKRRLKCMQKHTKDRIKKEWKRGCCNIFGG